MDNGQTGNSAGGRLIRYRATHTFAILALAALVAGCGVGPSPLASGSDEASAIQVPAAKGGVGKSKWTSDTSTSTTTESTTLADAEVVDTWTVQAWIGSAGGSLYIEDTAGGSREDLIVQLSVPRGALAEPHEITMTVRGYLLSELVVEFRPGGLEFLTDATLEIVLGLDRVDVDTQTLTVEHVYDDGTVEEAQLDALHLSGKRKLTIIAYVPGFSRYGLR